MHIEGQLTLTRLEAGESKKCLINSWPSGGKPWQRRVFNATSLIA